MKIAMIGHKRIPGRESGVEVAVGEIAVRMVALGHQVTAYNRAKRGFPHTKEVAGTRIITVPTINKKSLDAVIYAFFATCHAVCCKYDVIHYHAEGSCYMLWLTKLFQKRAIVTIHGLDWQRAKWGRFATRFIRFGESCAAKHADEIIVLSRNHQTYFSKTYNRSTCFVPNGVDIPTQCGDLYIRDRWRLSRNEYILYLGRIVPEKGLEDLIDAFKDIQTCKRLVIAGGSSHTDAYYEALKSRASSDSRVLCTGFVQGEALSALFSNALLYVLPSYVEGMPMSLLEAISYGKCCLVSDIPENTGVIGDAGRTFEVGNVKALRRSLSELLADEKQIVEFAAKAVERAKVYGWDRVVAETLQVYEGRKNNEELYCEGHWENQGGTVSS